MQSLLSGADCSTSANPLKQVLQREGVDNSLFRDRLAQSAGPSSQVNPRSFIKSSTPVAKEPFHANPTSHPFNLSHLSSALICRPSVQQPQQNDHSNSEWERSRGQLVPQRSQKLLGPAAPSTYGAEYAQWNGQRQAQPGWADSFQLEGKGKERLPPPNQVYSQLQARPYTPQHSFQSFQPMYSGNGFEQAHQPAKYNGRTEQEQRDMEAAFERALEDARAETGDKEVQTRRNDGEEDIEEIVREPKGDLEAVWESLRPEAERLGQLAEWERDFSQFASGEDDLYDSLNESLARDDFGQTSLDDQFEFGAGQHLDGFEDDGIPQARQYEYVSPNRFENVTPASAWARANHLLDTGGPLGEAALLLESFISRARQEDYNQLQVTNVEVWSMLGRTQAMNEKEEKALSAFAEGRRALGQEDPGREKVAGEMLTNLAISYVNESLDLAALTTLHDFLRLLHPAHAGNAPSRRAMTESTSPWGVPQQMTDSFLALARDQYTSHGQVDPDVQVGLGTSYYMMGEYSEARECWVAALGERPNDYLLWNRLGATMANGGNPEEAVDAYRRALELKPTFTRAIFNLGVACLNIGVHREAAEHFLAALSLHDRKSSVEADSRINDSGSLWMVLRRALIALDMPQLAERAKPGTDLQVFRQAGFEF